MISNEPVRWTLRRWCVVYLLVAACGPTIVLESDGDSGATTTTSTTSVPVTSTVPPDTTVAPTTVGPTSTGDPDTGLESDSGIGFIEDPDGGGVCQIYEGHWYCSWCDVSAQDCPQGEKCVGWANDGSTVWNATRCSPIQPDAGAIGDACMVEGSPWSGIDDCGADSMCWYADSTTQEGTCVEMCNSEARPDPCRPGLHCVLANDGVLVLCLPQCDPFDPTSCAPDQRCEYIEDAPYCVADEGEIYDEFCGLEGFCAVGSSCAPSEVLAACETTECCTPLCDLSAADPDLACAAEPGHTCQPLYGPGAAPPGLDHLGRCEVAP